MAPGLVGQSVSRDGADGSVFVVRARRGDGVVGGEDRSPRRIGRLADVLVEIVGRGDVAGVVVPPLRMGKRRNG